MQVCLWVRGQEGDGNEERNSRRKQTAMVRVGLNSTYACVWVSVVPLKCPT